MRYYFIFIFGCDIFRLYFQEILEYYYGVVVIFFYLYMVIECSIIMGINLQINCVKDILKLWSLKIDLIGKMYEIRKIIERLFILFFGDKFFCIVSYFKNLLVLYNNYGYVLLLVSLDC